MQSKIGGVENLRVDQTVDQKKKWGYDFSL
jgi:hypothetical protein